MLVVMNQAKLDAKTASFDLGEILVEMRALVSGLRIELQPLTLITFDGSVCSIFA